MINRRAFVSIVAGSGLAAALSGCSAAGHSIADQSLAFDSRSPNAIVIVGIKSERPLDLIFKRYDPNTNRLIAEGSDNEFVTRYGLFNKDRYKVHVVKPGDYAMHEMQTNTGEGYTSVRNFTTFGKRGDPLISNGAPIFSVAAGEIIYVGDFTVDNTDVRVASGIKFAIDLDAAREVLKTYPNIKGDLQTRVLRGLPPPRQRST
jgi:hypothetical protein